MNKKRRFKKEVMRIIKMYACQDIDGSKVLDCSDWENVTEEIWLYIFEVV